MRWLILLCVLLLPANLFAAHLMIVPNVVKSGEVAWVRWEGPELANAAVRFEDTLVPLTKRSGQWEALFGIDVDIEPGTYPLFVYASTSTGHSYNLRVDLTIQGVKRPVEHLTLPPGMVTPKEPEVLERISRENKLLAEIWKVWSGPMLAENFKRPVTQAVSSVFGKRRILNGVKKSRHSGTDFRSPAGTPVLSPAAGNVVLVADLFYTGKTVIIDHGGGLYSLMAHLRETTVKVGEQVSEGTTLGHVGSTGRSTGPHLHWTVKLNGVRVDPLSVVAAFEYETP